jgi:hypothetical protein
MTRAEAVRRAAIAFERAARARGETDSSIFTMTHSGFMPSDDYVSVIVFALLRRDEALQGHPADILLSRPEFHVRAAEAQARAYLASLLRLHVETSQKADRSRGRRAQKRS